MQSGLELLTIKTPRGTDQSPIHFSLDGNSLRLIIGEGAVFLEATHPSPALQRQREAQAVVAPLFVRLVKKAAVLHYLRQHPHADEKFRAELMARAERYVQVPEDLNDASWKIVREPNAKPEDYQRALLQAEAACSLQAGAGYFLTTLGVAQYRLGKYAEALRTLAQSDKLNGQGFDTSLSIDLAFLAMTEYRLDHKDKAQHYLNRLREARKQERWYRNNEPAAFLREAETLLQGGGGQP
jgi:hypothetical protein